MLIEPIRSRNYLSYLQLFQMHFLKVLGKNKRFLQFLIFFFTRGPPGGLLKILARFLFGEKSIVGHVQS